MPKECELMQMLCNTSKHPPLQNPKWVQCRWRSKSRLKQLLRLIVDTYQWQAGKSGNSREGVGQTDTHVHREKKSEIDNKVSSSCNLGLGRKALGPGSTAHQNTIPVVPPSNPTAFGTEQS